MLRLARPPRLASVPSSHLGAVLAAPFLLASLQTISCERNSLGKLRKTAMPRFHFDVRYGRQDWSDDADGVELRDALEARNQAFDLERGLAKHHIDGNREIRAR